MSEMDIRIIGVHSIEPSAQELDEAIFMWGSDLEGDQLARARRMTLEHFNALRLIEIEIIPPDGEIDWSLITQPVEGIERDNWQVAYDEEPVDSAHGRWAFFLHEVDATKPLWTPVGERVLPAATPLPEYLAGKAYLPP